MTTDETRALLADFYATLAKGDRAHLMELLAPDVQWQMPASVPDGILDGRERVADELGTATVRRLFRKGTFRLTIRNVWADGNIGIAQTSTHAVTQAGKDYDMEYVWVYTCENRKIRHIREYLDTRLAAQSLGWDA
ncbi:MAG: ketosteroid isomerase [Massilia sp.]|jgi:ketosteroid isomerase-like protein|nr:ketosteroid isomerase [Massilia sp.]